jgi:hypothetical protein
MTSTDLATIRDQAEAATEGIPGVTVVVCPPWCDDHERFDDGSADWHKSHDEGAIAAGAEYDIMSYMRH